MCKLFMIFGSSQFLDIGPNKVLCAALGALNHNTRKFHMEQGFHLAATWQKTSSFNSARFSENQHKKRQRIKLSLLLDVGGKK